jgi:YD repeat-containing protein
MKKIICLLSLSFLILQSCSSDSSSSSPTNNPLLKSETITDASDGSSYTINYTYNGNKLLKATYSDDGSYDKYYYTGDLITKIEFYDDVDFLEQKVTYTYNADNKLVSYVDLNFNSDDGIRETYTYNPDGTVTVVTYIGDTVSQTDLNATRTITFLANGEVVSDESVSGSSTLTYTYDTKNNPYKNITGMDKISGYADSENVGIIHNVLTKVQTSGTFTYTTNFEYTYNANDYPTTVTDSQSGILSETTAYTYY